MGRDGAKVLSQ